MAGAVEMMNFVALMQARPLSEHFTAADLCCAGETWQRVKVPNEPKQADTWRALERLCSDILEPVAAQFDMPRITYGVASLALFRHIPARTAKALDQHAGCELGRTGRPICPRLGAAVDFHVPSISATVLANWIADNLPFDRMYFYGPDRPLHVSVGPENIKALVEMQTHPSGRRIPRVRPLSWLKDLES